METLEYTVRKVYSALKDTEDYISRRYNYIEPLLPDDIFFITSQELEDMFPDCTPKERELRIAKAKWRRIHLTDRKSARFRRKARTDVRRTMTTGS